MVSLHIMKYYCVQKQFRKDSTDQQEENEEVPPKDRAKFTPHLQESQGREIKWNNGIYIKPNIELRSGSVHYKNETLMFHQK